MSSILIERWANRPACSKCRKIRRLIARPLLSTQQGAKGVQSPQKSFVQTASGSAFKTATDEITITMGGTLFTSTPSSAAVRAGGLTVTWTLANSTFRNPINSPPIAREGMVKRIGRAIDLAIRPSTGVAGGFTVGRTADWTDAQIDANIVRVSDTQVDFTCPPMPSYFNEPRFSEPIDADVDRQAITDPYPFLFIPGIGQGKIFRDPFRYGILDSFGCTSPEPPPDRILATRNCTTCDFSHYTTPNVGAEGWPGCTSTIEIRSLSPDADVAAYFNVDYDTHPGEMPGVVFPEDAPGETASTYNSGIVTPTCGDPAQTCNFVLAANNFGRIQFGNRLANEFEGIGSNPSINAPNWDPYVGGAMMGSPEPFTFLP